MTECAQCGRSADDLWAVAGEHGKTEFVCGNCAPTPARCDVTGDEHLRCPNCESAKYTDVSEEYWFHRRGGLFQCDRGHLFTVRTVTEEVCIPDD